MEYMYVYNCMLSLSAKLCVGGTSTPTEQKEEWNWATQTKGTGMAFTLLAVRFFFENLSNDLRADYEK